MKIKELTKSFLLYEAKSLVKRLKNLKPFIIQETMIPAASINPATMIAIEERLSNGRRKLKYLIDSFVKWLQNLEDYKPVEAQRKFSLLRIRFNSILSQYDIFSDALTQRSELETGLWLAGLDVLAEDALSLGKYYKCPPVMCYLDRGIGAAIRRAHTRLPGGDKNPIAIIRIPRERMVGCGIASSLVHEVGHQASVLLGLQQSLIPIVKERGKKSKKIAWKLFERWLSEILADFWAVGKLGITATLGLMAVVSLPKAFVFRFNIDDPHPFPYIRVKISYTIGKLLFPYHQWDRLGEIWESFYPLAEAGKEIREIIKLTEENLYEFVKLLLDHKPKSLNGMSLKEIMVERGKEPKNLIRYYREIKNNNISLLKKVSPCVAFAIIGIAKIEGLIQPEEECEIIDKLLKEWAINNKIDIYKIYLKKD